MSIQDFDPSGFALKNDNFIGLPFTEESANLVLLPVPWEATVSYSAGTAEGPANILEASYQLDLYLADCPDAYKMGIYMRQPDAQILAQSQAARSLASRHIDALEAGEGGDEAARLAVNVACEKLENWVYQQAKDLLEQGKYVGLLGGDHSTPLGYLRALAERHEEGFAILQIDAHCDLREAYEGFTYSHASIFYNALERMPKLSLVQMGIRDYCHEEVDYIQQQGERIQVLFDQDLARGKMRGLSFEELVLPFIESLPQKIYISFDIDGLRPELCPNTGTPVLGGFDLAEVSYIFELLAQAGKELIGFDLCEVGAATEWDGNVGARVCYQLAALLARTQALV